MEGKRWVKFWESITKWEWYKDANTARLYFHLVIKAQYKDTKWRGYMIPRGCVVTSFKRLSEELGLSIQNLRTALKHLIESENIENLTYEVTNLKKTNFTIYKVNNYDLFQGDNEQTNTRLTNDQQTTNKQLTTYKKEKKEKKEKNNSNKDKFSVRRSIEQIEIVPELKDALLAFAEMRRQIKAPIGTERALNLLISRLNEIGKTDQEKIAIVNQSIERGWRGFFEIKAPYQQPSYQQKPVNQGLPDWYSNVESQPPDNDVLARAMAIQKKATEEKGRENRAYHEN